MKKLLLIVLLGHFAVAQSAYSGRTAISGASSLGQFQSCGVPPYSLNTSCFNQSTLALSLSNPIPTWGPNVAPGGTNGSNPYQIEQVGNLTGAGRWTTPLPWGMPILRCTDSSMFGGPLWGNADNGEPNLWAPDDSGLILKQNGGTRYLMNFDGVACHPISGLSWTGPVIYDHSSPATVYTLEGSNLNQIYQSLLSITGCPSSCVGSVTAHTMLYDFAQTTGAGANLCLTNSYNGNPSWGGGGSVGLFTDSNDDTMFSIEYSDTGVVGQHGRWVASWKKSYGATGRCDLWDTQSQKYQNNAGAQATVTINPPYHAGDTFSLHEAFSALGDSYALATGNNFTYGPGVEGVYLWQVGTAAVNFCGYPSPSPITGYTVIGALTSSTFVVGDTVTQTGTGATGVVILPLPGATLPLEISTLSGTPNATGTWVDSNGAVFTPSNYAPAANPTAHYDCSGHFGDGFNGLFVGKNGQYNSYANPATPLTNFTPNGAPCNDSHFTLNHASASDTYPPGITSQDYYDPSVSLAQLQNNVATINCPYMDEFYLGISGGAGPLRVGPTVNSGWEWSFDANNSGVCIESPSGKYVSCLSDDWGAFGNLDNVHGSCNVGGPNWKKNDSTDYVAGSGPGSLIMPQAGNAGHYVYQVSSCSGTCTTGAAAPTWTQSNTVAGVGSITDGTITWVGAPDINTPANTATSNCRPEVMIMKLFQ